MSSPDVASVLRLALPSARRFLPGLVAGVASAACAVALLAASAWLITRAAEQPPILFLSMAVVGVRAFALGRSALRYLERLSSHDAAFRQLAELRVGVLSRLIPLAPAGLGSIGRGDLLTRLVKDVDDLQDLPLRVVQPLVSSGILVMGSVVGVWLIFPAAGATLAVCLLAAGAVGMVSAAAISARSERELAPLRGALTNEVLEITENLGVLVAFGALDDRLATLDEIDGRLRRATIRRSLGFGVQAGVTSLFAGAATVAALAFGTPALGTPGGLHGPAFAVIVLIPLAVFEVFGMVAPALGAWRMVCSSAERVATAVPTDIPAEIPIERHDDRVRADADADAAADGVGVGLEPALELSDLSVRWPGVSLPAVAGVSLRLAAGDRVHLAGPSGAGKSTLANALVRFVEYSGSYRLGGVEARELPQSEVRRVVGLCEQRPWLFDDSIRQNLLFARDTATDAELLAMLDRVGLAEWADARGGLDARVGERGALVSGGQAQRIALARALLAEFPVLVVDEPTANVDADRGDALVRDILAAAGPERAVLLISHTPVPEELITKRLTLAAPAPAP
ncbi:thiol reductant ABC exporter subunit CydC [Glaciibacter superstes]|uniref:thiol reductant ABC exporter subunit CydC n=1 Tax=Glaciibacter superstes TaxID=501023 RepID=UPI000426554D|nr:thiol reductant ABC exporter subunit CydC [Glaciibacter superstes]